MFKAVYTNSYMMSEFVRPRTSCTSWYIKRLYTTLKEKRVLKQCPWGTILENGAFFSKNDTNLVPLGHQNEVLFYGRSNGAPRALFWCHLFF